jgi:hypothetical protein
MMMASMRVFAGAMVALLLAFHASHAGTIIKLDLGGTGPDTTYSGGLGGTFSTLNDGDGATTGDQNTAILFTDFLSGMGSTTGSYTLSGVTAVGAPTSGAFVTQNFNGGNFKLYDSANALLMDVNIASSALIGGAGSGTGAEFSLSSGTIVGGTLLPLLVSNSIDYSMTLTNISGGGLTVTSGALNSFVADSTKAITATQIPEPAAILLAFAAACVPIFRRRR